jgi:hypothetical protein
MRSWTLRCKHIRVTQSPVYDEVSANVEIIDSL